MRPSEQREIRDNPSDHDNSDGDDDNSNGSSSHSRSSSYISDDLHSSTSNISNESNSRSWSLRKYFYKYNIRKSSTSLNDQLTKIRRLSDPTRTSIIPKTVKDLMLSRTELSITKHLIRMKKYSISADTIFKEAIMSIPRLSYLRNLVNEQDRST